MAVLFNAFGSAAGNTDSLAWSHTINAGSDRFLVVAVAVLIGDDVTNVSIAGTNLTFLRRDENTDASATEIWYLKEADFPSTGSLTITATIDSMSRVVGGSLAWTGVDQTTPFQTEATEQADASQAMNVSVSTDTGNYVMDAVSISDNETMTVDVSQAEEVNLNSAAVLRLAMSIQSNTGTVEMDWTTSANVDYVSTGLSLAAAGGLSTFNVQKASNLRVKVLDVQVTKASNLRVKVLDNQVTKASNLRVKVLDVQVTKASNLRVKALDQDVQKASNIRVKALDQQVTKASNLKVILIADVQVASNLRVKALGQDVQKASNLRVKQLGVQVTKASNLRVIIISDIQVASNLRVKALGQQVTKASNLRVKALGQQVTKSSNLRVKQQNIQITKASNLKVVILAQQVTKLSNLRIKALNVQVTKSSNLRVIIISDVQKASNLRVKALGQNIQKASNLRVKVFDQQVTKASNLRVIIQSDVQVVSNLRVKALGQQVTKLSNLRVKQQNVQITKASNLRVIIISDVQKASNLRVKVLDNQVTKASNLRVKQQNIQITKSSNLKVVILDQQVTKASNLRVKAIDNQITKLSNLRVKAINNQVLKASNLRVLLIANIQKASNLRVKALAQQITKASNLRVVDFGLGQVIKLSNLRVKVVGQQITLSSNLKVRVPPLFTIQVDDADVDCVRKLMTQAGREAIVVRDDDIVPVFSSGSDFRVYTDFQDIMDIQHIRLTTDIDHSGINFVSGAVIYPKEGRIDLLDVDVPISLPAGTDEVLITYATRDGLDDDSIQLNIDMAKSYLQTELWRTTLDFSGSTTYETMAKWTMCAVASYWSILAMNSSNAIQSGFNYRIAEFEIQTKLWGEGMIAETLLNKYWERATKMINALKIYESHPDAPLYVVRRGDSRVPYNRDVNIFTTMTSMEAVTLKDSKSEFAIIMKIWG